jgi:hypothetical protein
MSGKEFFRDCCEKLSLDCDTLFILGEGNPNNPDRFEFKCSPSRRKPTQRFAVKFFTGEQVFVAWDLREPKAAKKSKFSLSKAKLKGIQKDMICVPSKHIEYSGWNEENVYVFPKEAVEMFLRSYISPFCNS